MSSSSHSNRPTAAAIDAQTPGDAKLLAIDDSALMHRLLTARLKSERLEIHCAGSGEEGIRMARELQPDVILLDVDMPGMDGFAVLRELKNDPNTHDMPVIFVSGSANTDDKVRAFELGAMDFVGKPFDVAELRARVRAAVRLQQVIRMLAQRAQLDGLTGLWNREYFDNRLAQEVAAASRHGIPLALAMCDLDNFKQLNDNHGHPFGDQVLEEFARLLGTLRSHDVCCRYGGEEFSIILPQTTAEEAAGVVDRIRDRIGSLCWENHPGLQVTASFGVSDLMRIDVATPLHLVTSADEALYAAKQKGRNRVEIAPPSRGTDSDARPRQRTAADRKVA